MADIHPLTNKYLAGRAMDELTYERVKKWN
jgi:hypothetical protein